MHTPLHKTVVACGVNPPPRTNLQQFCRAGFLDFHNASSTQLTLFTTVTQTEPRLRFRILALLSSTTTPLCRQPEPSSAQRGPSSRPELPSSHKLKMASPAQQHGLDAVIKVRMRRRQRRLPSRGLRSFGRVPWARRQCISGT
jgi:hypothetical protein